ncbi:hypothetical protein L195_g055200 [Trifolium pratense]|uniref:Uncharacterized protein n=1 Tax=Trifolium pratense TaxID=57577 RepID=A0A2K3KK70_TRIPR|nr:hypothetical protein L195_g055200 [Trifolium pratense]
MVNWSRISFHSIARPFMALCSCNGDQSVAQNRRRTIQSRSQALNLNSCSRNSNLFPKSEQTIYTVCHHAARQIHHAARGA